MHQTLFLIAFAILAPPSLGIAAGGELFSLTKPWLDPRPSERAVPRVEESIRLKMIAELTEAKRLPGVTLPYGIPKIDILLIDLGDEVTIHQYIEDYFGPTQKRVAADVLAAARHPSLIALVEKYLFREEPAEARFDSDAVVEARSVAAAYLCRNMVQRCPEFEESTKAWASQLRKAARNRAAQRDAVRIFWRENEAHLKAKNYQAVRPPTTSVVTPPRAQPVTSSSNAPAAVPVAAPVRTNNAPTVSVSIPPTTPPLAPAITPMPAPSRAVSGSPSSPLSTPPAPPPAWSWLVVVGAILGGLLWWRSR